MCAVIRQRGPIRKMPAAHRGAGLSRARPALLEHLDQHPAALAGVDHLARERDPAALEAIGGPDAVAMAWLSAAIRAAARGAPLRS